MTLPLIILDQVESTNNYAMGLVQHSPLPSGQQPVVHGTAVLTLNQTHGKGQRGKQWFSEAGKNVAVSIILQPDLLSVSQVFLLSMAVAVATAKLVKKYVDDEVSIKWPNDIYWRDRKAAGILIENVLQQNKFRYAVVGIGLNVNQTNFPDMENTPVSLKQITGKEFDPVALAAELRDAVVNQYSSLSNPTHTSSEYRQLLYKKDEVVRLKKNNRVFEAVIKNVTNSGELVVNHGIDEQFSVGEVEWLLK